MIKYLIGIGLLAVTLPFWLPTSLGGDTYYHYVLSDSMKGSVDAGALVILRREPTYQVGDVVAYRQDFGGGDRVIILHRIIEQLPDGRYLIKGDAASGVDQVEKEAITGKMVAAAPWLGYVPGAFRQAPALLAGLLLATALLFGGSGKSKGKEAAKGGSLFLQASLVLLLAFPFASLGAANLLGRVPLFMLLAGLAVVTRLAEVHWTGSPNAALLVEANYMFVLVLAGTAVSLPAVSEAARTVLTF